MSKMTPFELAEATFAADGQRDRITPYALATALEAVATALRSTGDHATPRSHIDTHEDGIGNLVHTVSISLPRFGYRTSLALLIPHAG